MNKRIIVVGLLAVLLTSCVGEYNKVYKTTDMDYRYEYAKQSFAEGKYARAASLLLDLITQKKGHDDAEEALYMLAMSEYMSSDYESASATFKKYYQTYPKGDYAELRRSMWGSRSMKGHPSHDSTRHPPSAPSTPISSFSTSSLRAS